MRLADLTPRRLTLALERRLYLPLRALADRRLARRALRSGLQPKPPHLLLGERGEDAAFFHLRALGFTVAARRWRSARLPGDLDLLAWDGDTLVVFEIKTRTAAAAEDLFAPAETAVDAHKQETLRRLAAAYLAQLPEAYRTAVPLRFDILSVYFPAGSATTSSAEPTFEHFRSAFPRTSPARLPSRAENGRSRWP